VGFAMGRYLGACFRNIAAATQKSFRCKVANTVAAFVKANLPFGQGETLTDQEAFDVAEFFTRQPRPDFAGKLEDWRKGGKPEDARY
jgi:cytochrome c